MKKTMKKPLINKKDYMDVLREVIFALYAVTLYAVVVFWGLILLIGLFFIISLIRG